MIRIVELAQCKKGKFRVHLSNGITLPLYQGEIRSYHLTEGEEISDQIYEEIFCEVLIKRAKRRAMHLLEKMDRTEAGLRGKLQQNEYPAEAIEEAISYVKHYHYLDDARYAANYVRSYQGSRSRGRIRMDLLSKGISKVDIERAFETEYEADEQRMIQRLLEKKGYNNDMQPKERQRIYAFLMRRGFRSEDILKVMKCSDYLT